MSNEARLFYFHVAHRPFPPKVVFKITLLVPARDLASEPLALFVCLFPPRPGVTRCWPRPSRAQRHAVDQQE